MSNDPTCSCGSPSPLLHDVACPVNDEKLYRFHWRSSASKPSEGRGRDVADAFSRLGYGGGAIKALDYYEVVSESSSSSSGDAR